MRDRLTAAVLVVTDAVYTVRHEQSLHLGRFYITSTKRHWLSNKNAFEMGREYERTRDGRGPLAPPPRMRHLKAL